VVYPTGLADTFLYAADTLRQQAVTASGTVNFVWDQANVLMEKDQGLLTQAHYSDYPGMWGGLSSQRRGSVSSFYGVDQQANVRVLADSTGTISDSYLFKAFGEELASTGSTINPLRFGGLVGYYRDIANRMYARARHLNSLQGRWLSRDPEKVHYSPRVVASKRFARIASSISGIRLQTVNETDQLYTYVRNRAPLWIDLSGARDCLIEFNNCMNQVQKEFWSCVWDKVPSILGWDTALCVLGCIAPAVIAGPLAVPVYALCFTICDVGVSAALIINELTPCFADRDPGRARCAAE
jgi:hypothetical protein